MARLSLSQERDKLSKERRAKYLSKKPTSLYLEKFGIMLRPTAGICI